MATNQIRFSDGAAYERYMGEWSRRVGDTFIDWLTPEPGLRWLDIGCGNGAFTEMLVERGTPGSIHGVDPSEAQLLHARSRPLLRGAEFIQADAMALPFPDDSFDAAVMPLVIFFLTDPSRGVAEMKRVVSAGGIVAAYAWDIVGGGFPYASLQAELREMGALLPTAPSPDASRLDVLHELWSDAGLGDVDTRTITVERTFSDFDDYWATILGGASVGPALAAMTGEELSTLSARMRTLLPADAAGRITCSGRANGVKGRVPLDTPID